MCRTEQGLRDWEEVEVRVKELIKEEKVWRNKGSKGGTGRDDESEERERRIFIEALRDGYVLCQ
ncbi:hypothetical protein BDN70DRAFT_874898 [Pholiota conissans]|uniref:Uncharacterized protein n=1 Tax=Pholiota conissans TaxID=109636 RepID=A0A9P5Z821_9AGAR|nr:hypothetical protein BDN70DRAFT_874898 [Pholiota conissans]